MILATLVQMVMDNPRLDLMYFLTGVLIALLPTSVLGLIGFFVIRDWYRQRREHKAAAAPPGRTP